MGSVRWNLLMVGALVVASALPAAAAEADITVHGIEAAAVATLSAVEEATAPWQPLFATVDEVAQGNNPLTGFGVLAARTNDSAGRLALTLPSDSPLETVQSGSIPYYEGQGAVTFALLQSALPAEGVEGEAVEFAFYWRWPGLPTQPANPDANGDATEGATNTFSIGRVHEEEFATFTQSDGTSLIEYDSRSIAAWEFVADDSYNLLIAIPGLPEAVWGSALNAESTDDPSQFAIQIISEVTGLGEDLDFTLAEQGVLRAPDMTTRWIEMTTEGGTVSDLLATSDDSEAPAEQIDAGAALPANPPVEVDVSGQVVESAQDTSGTLWRWILGVFVGAGLIALLLWLLIYRPRRPSESWGEMRYGVTPEQAMAAAREWKKQGAEVIDGHVIGTLEQWERAIPGFDMHLTNKDRLEAYVKGTFGKGMFLFRGKTSILEYQLRRRSNNPMREYWFDTEQIEIEEGSRVGIDLETGIMRALSWDDRIGKHVEVPWPLPGVGDSKPSKPTPWTDADREREGEAMLGGEDEYVDKHGHPL